MRRKIIQILMGIVALEAVVVMVGWIFNIDALTRVFSGGINMSFPTALIFFLSAIGLYYVHRTVKDEYEFSDILLSGITLFVFLILITLVVGYFTGVQTGIENLFLQAQQYQLLNTTIAGGPAIPTMIGFSLFGWANIAALFPGKKRNTLLGVIGYVIFVCNIVFVIGYLANIPVLYFKFNNSVTPIAFNTALSFLLLSFCLILIAKNSASHET